MFRGMILSSFVLVTSLFASMEVEPNGSFEKAQEIYNYDTVYATSKINSSDYDYYKFRLEGHAFNFSFQTREENMEYYIYLYNQQHKEIEHFTVHKGETGFNITLGANPGTVYVKVSSSNYTGSTRSYQISVDGIGLQEITRHYEIQPNGSFESANEISEGVYTTGYITKGTYDYDFYKFRNYSGTMRLTFNTLEENIDYYIYVYDQQHNQIKRFYLPKGNLDLDETFGISEGIVYVKVSAGNYNTDGFGEYQIAVNPNQNPLPPVPVPTSCTITDLFLGDVQVGWFDSNCMSQVKNGSYAKRYRINIAYPTTVDISLSSNSVDTYLSIIDSFGNVIGVDDDGGNGTNSHLLLSLQAGTYLVEATTYFPALSGDFTIEYSDDVNHTKIFYGALAYDKYTGYWATGWRYNTLEGAKTSTINTCNSIGCEIVATVRGDECVALANDMMTGEYEISYATTKYEAEDLANFVCELFHSNCVVQTSVCADGR